jgi:hypothetical protein
MSREDARGDYGQPPTDWCDWWSGVTRLTDDLYYGWPEGETKPWFWHWCTARNMWDGAGTGGHDLIKREPLHLEPSLHWPGCCGLHGWVRQGTWCPC